MSEGYKTKILVVEEEPDISALLFIRLRFKNYHPLVTSDLQEALKIAKTHQPEVILLDIDMPKTNAIATISRFVQIASTSVIVMSSQSDTPSKINALDSGADDYVVKPFDFEELMARIRVAIRRNLTGQVVTAYPVFTDGYLTVDLNRRYVERAGERVKLSPLEYTLLATLASQKDRLLTRRQILQKVWGKYAEDTEILRTALKQLRRKIEPEPSKPVYIITEGRAGYRFIMPHEKS
jgi:two-component system, OmpR family, KDP operon response regulator KdpE